MIQHIVFFLLANVLIPFLPIPAQVFLSYTPYSFHSKQISIFEQMNISRLFNAQDFKRSFRQSLKRLHPDRGGNQQAFSRVKSIKSIMEREQNYYDLYNVTQTSMGGKEQEFIQVVEMKAMVHIFQNIAFYFIALLYILAFTLDDQLRPSRKVLLPLTIVFAAYQFFIYFYPKKHTLIDYIDNKTPLFIQSALLKRLFSILSAIVRVKYLRKPNIQKNLLHQLSIQGDNKNQQDYKKILDKLHIIYAEKVQMSRNQANSLLHKLKNWISKGLSILIIGFMIWGMVSQSQSHEEQYY